MACSMREISRTLHRFYTSFNISKSTNSVKVVSFDVMDTIIAMNEPFNVVYSRVANTYGFPVDPSLVAVTFPKYMRTLSATHPCFGFHSIGYFEWWKRVVLGCLEEAIGESIPREKAVDIAKDLFEFYATANAWHIVDPKLEAVINNIRWSGISVVIVSNFDGRLKKILQELDLYSLFDFIVASGEVGVEKPSPNIFRLVTNHYQLLSSSELLHIGDSVENDYLAAKNFGANALLFDPSSLNNDVSKADKISSFSQLTVP
ncbi:HAD hydrolase, REG-2-like, family IA [Dictyocaulus viviparus]|uniref:HAD hydrolase, REG-2-like, family IA n=1 Tax=Dictyocaulus viviparus TaxID=29172 RepID=A0A0D8XVH0_DICVI|nr:HAD hydrolase, REG-2-like, family IA [Dictyocaulus viviparus]